MRSEGKKRTLELSLIQGFSCVKSIYVLSLVVPTGIVPQAIKDYVSKHYPEAKILKIERDSKTYEVKLNNQLELEFNKAFQLIDIDN